MPNVLMLTIKSYLLSLALKLMIIYLVDFESCKLNEINEI